MGVLEAWPHVNDGATVFVEAVYHAVGDRQILSFDFAARRDAHFPGLALDPNLKTGVRLEPDAV